MMYQLENEYLRARVSDYGAEMHSLCDRASGRELIWQRDAALWGDSAPWLFPVIGQLRDGGYTYGDRAYQMPMHGFACRETFTVVESSGDALCLELTESKNTLAIYPWRFSLVIAYRLCGREMRISCAVRNHDDKTMYFSFGAHPGFACRAGDRLHLHMSTEAPVLRLRGEDHLLSLAACGRTKPDVILSDALFDQDAMILANAGATGATLIRQDGGGIAFEFGRVPYLGLWSRKNGSVPYVCVEPWYGVDDTVDAMGDIREKLGIQKLLPEETFSMDMTITPIDAGKEAR